MNVKFNRISNHTGDVKPSVKAAAAIFKKLLKAAINFEKGYTSETGKKKNKFAGQ